MDLDPYIGEKLVASKHREMLAAAASDRLVGHGPVWTWAAHVASTLLHKASTLTAQYDMRPTTPRSTTVRRITHLTNASGKRGLP